MSQNRISKGAAFLLCVVESEIQFFIWHNGNMVYEFTNTDSNAYVFFHRLIGSDDYLYCTNAHGDVVKLVNSNGIVVKTYDYDAFGNETGLSENDTNPYRYAGEYFDTETGTIYLRARYYNPTVGRFSTVDPIRDGLNWYVYCGNSPVIFVDPNGFKREKEFDSADAAAVDFAMRYNQASIEKDVEYGAAIYKVTIYRAYAVEEEPLFGPKEKLVADYDTVVYSYYTYTDPKEGSPGSGSVNPSNVPKSKYSYIVHEEVAQIHTHGAYSIGSHYDAKEDKNMFGQYLEGFSSADIKSAKARGVDTYMVSPWGHLFKATKDDNYYADKEKPYIRGLFYRAPLINEVYGLD